MSAASLVEDIVFPVDRPSAFEFPEVYHKLQKEKPFAKVKLKIGGGEAWLLTRYDDVRNVLVNKDLSADPGSEGYPHITEGHKATAKRAGDFVYLDDPEHMRFRSFLTRDFMVKNINGLRPDIENIVDGLIDDMLAKGPDLDFVSEFALPVPSMVICRMLGVSYDDHEFFQDLTQTRLKINNTAEETAKAINALIEYLDRVVFEKEKKPTDDILSRLAANVGTGDITHEEVVNISRLLVSAGHETTANTIALATVLLLRHPDQMEALIADPGLAPQATEEVLRYTSIVHTTPRRTALKDIEVNGHKIAAGEGVIPLTAMANRDPEVFARPNEFDISRGARNHLTFNHGPHHCLGANLARLEMHVVMERAYKRLPGLAFATPYEEIDFKLDSLMLGVNKMPITWKV